MKYLIIAALAFTGCSTLFKPTVTTTPVTIPATTNVVVTTNTPAPVVTPTATNYPPPIVVTNTIVTPPRIEIVTITNWIPNPAITSGISTAQAANAALNPTPTEPFIHWGLSGLSAALALIAAWKNKQAGTANSLLKTVTTAVETYPGTELDSVKKHIAGVSAILGTTDALDSVVQNLPKNIAPVAKPTA